HWSTPPAAPQPGARRFRAAVAASGHGARHDVCIPVPAWHIIVATRIVPESSPPLAANVHEYLLRRPAKPPRAGPDAARAGRDAHPYRPRTGGPAVVLLRRHRRAVPGGGRRGRGGAARRGVAAPSGHAAPRRAARPPVALVR